MEPKTIEHRITSSKFAEERKETFFRSYYRSMELMIERLKTKIANNSKPDQK